MKKGFTLIELLAVIIILAILMIIAVPNILSTLATARSSSFITQAQSIYKAAEKQYMIDSMSGTTTSCYDSSNLDLSSISSTVSFSVNMGSNGTVSSIAISDSGQSLKATGTTINDIALTDYSTGTITCSGSSQTAFGGTKVSAGSGDTHKGIVYLDPSDLTATCTSTSTLTTTNTGCKKFYIFDDSGSTYKMIMWKNTTNTPAWYSSGSSIMNEIATALLADTAGWSGSPRLITADEIAHIVGISNATTDTPPGTGWSSSSATNWFYFDGSGDSYSSSDGWHKQNLINSKSKYLWLYDYTVDCTSYGCENADSGDTTGYWTSTASIEDPNHVWQVFSFGGMDWEADPDSLFGIRPVIVLSKSSIS